MESAVSIGVDIGQQKDPTALVVCEATRRVTGGGEWVMPRGERVVSGEDIHRAPGRAETVYTARDLWRLPLGTPYPAVAAEVARVVRALQARKVWQPFVLVDCTGVGLPVFELIHEAVRDVQPRPRLVAVTFTHGDKYTRERSTASVGKAHLVSRLQALLQTERIKLPDTDEARVLARELQDYEIRVDANANDTYGAFRVGTHDDLVTALGLAVLDDPIKEAERSRLHVFDWRGRPRS